MSLFWNVHRVKSPIPDFVQSPVDPSIQDYLYDLPDELIARYPVEPYDQCRLMRLNVSQCEVQDDYFYNLPDLLEPGDLLIVNNTLVEARRIFLRRGSVQRGENKREISGARIEAVFLERTDRPPVKSQNPCWAVLIKKRQRLNDGETLYCEKDPSVIFRIHKLPDGRTFLEESLMMTAEVFERVGQMPIPPYLKREEEKIDRHAYQNPFLKGEGASVAAPTASLHFTDELIKKIKLSGVEMDSVTLNIGYGTFAPLKEENFKENRLHREFYTISESLAEKLALKKYKKLYAVGTTTLRALETVYRKTDGRYDDFLTGYTESFFRPPEKILSVDGLITNFHLPGSSLMMLVACLTGRDLLLAAYRHAVEKKYRFFSYGDAMFIRKT